MRKMMYGVCCIEPDCLVLCLHHICMLLACNLLIAVGRARAEYWLLSGRLGKCHSSSAYLSRGYINFYTFLNGPSNKCESEANCPDPSSKFLSVEEKALFFLSFPKQGKNVVSPGPSCSTTWLLVKHYLSLSFTFFLVVHILPWISIKLTGIQRKGQCTFCSFFIWILNGNDLQCYKL